MIRATPGRIAFDTNILVYAEGLGDTARVEAARNLVTKLSPNAVCLPVQTLGELLNVLSRKVGYTANAARDSLLSWSDAFEVVPTTMAIMMAATDLVADHRFGIWDAVILSAAADAGCRLLLSEDMQDGFTWRGVTITNPFKPERHKLLGALLAG